jgi:hypothetical protein
MTMITVILLGLGMVLIASSLDNTPLVTTFQKIMSGQPINWNGGNSDGVTSKSPEDTPQDVTPPPNNPNGVA